jgi:Prenyltransferase and squalene oxidase repeat
MPFVLAALLAALPVAPEERALVYLARQVPAWSPANKCYSCHNNGNAARALYTAARLGYAIPDRSLADTTRWLSRPAAWEQNGADESFNDRDLARLQFTLALFDGSEADRIRERQSLLTATAAIAARQRRDGAWSIGPDDNIGSPTTYGSTLATAEIRSLLGRVDPGRYHEAIRRADDWLTHKKVNSVVDAAAVLLTLDASATQTAVSRRQECLALLRKGESKEGGWGPYANSAPEAFDTALVLLALRRQPPTTDTRAWLRRGRAYLVRTQRPDGSWQETTRPPSAESYAERISTAGWATRALLATRAEPTDAGAAKRRSAP